MAPVTPNVSVMIAGHKADPLWITKFLQPTGGGREFGAGGMKTSRPITEVMCEWGQKHIKRIKARKK